METLTEKLLSTNNEIRIFSGEGEEGSFETYTGKRTVRTLKLRLEKERCHGDRWAQAQILIPETETHIAYFCSLDV